jgi:O-antigen/teichoic acid export membrane protein
MTYSPTTTDAALSETVVGAAQSPPTSAGERPAAAEVHAAVEDRTDEPSTTRRYAKTLLALVDQAIVSGANFAITVVVARSAGINELGVYALAFTIGIFLAAIQESLIVLPYTVYGNRLSGVARARCAGAALVQQVGLSLSATVVLMLAVAALSLATASYSREMWILTGIVPFLLLREFARRMSFADLRIAAALVLDGSVTFLLLSSLLFLAWREQLSAAAALVCLGGASGIGGLGWLLAGRRNFIFQRESIRTEMRRNATIGGWACLARVTGVAEGYAVHWLLYLLLGAAATGAFAACLTIVSLSNPLLMGVGAVLAPYAAQAYARGSVEGLRQLVRRANQWLWPPMVLFTAVVVIFGGDALRLVYQDEVAPYAPTVAVLALAVLASTMGMAADNALRALEKTRANFIASACGVALSSLIALLTIPSFGTLGAAWGLAVGSAATAAIRYLAMRQALRCEEGPSP